MGLGLAASWHVSSSQTREQTCVPCLGRGILNHWTTREVQPLLLSHQVWEREKHLWPDLQGIRGKRGGSHSVSRVLILVWEWVSVVSSVQFCSVTQSCSTLCDPIDCSTPGLPVHHQLPESTQIHAHWVGDAIQPSHLPSSPSPPAFNLSQHQGLFQSINSLHQVAKVLEFQLQHQSWQWTLRPDFL